MLIVRQVLRFLSESGEYTFLVLLATIELDSREVGKTFQRIGENFALQVTLLFRHSWVAKCRQSQKVNGLKNIENLLEYLARDIAPTPTIGTTDKETMHSFGEVQ